MTKSNRMALIFGIFATVTSIFDWYLNASIRNPPFTKQERLIYKCFLGKPKRAMPPPDLSPVGIAYLLAVIVGVFFLGFMIYRSVESIRADCRIRIIALIAGVFAAGLVCYGDFMLPAVMRLYFAASFGIMVYLWSYLIFRLPKHVMRHPK